MSLSDRIRNSVFIKMVFIGIIIVILLVPLLLIRGVISERQLRRDQAVYDVGEKWGGSQQIAGPIITVPYLVHYRDEKNILRSRKAYTQFLPEELNVRATLDTQIRSRGIFDVVVYTTHLDCAGSFGPLPLAEMNVALEDFLWDEAYIIIAVSDMRGITRAAEMEWNGEGHAFEPGVLNTELFVSGIHAELPGLAGGTGSDGTFSFTLDLNGSETIEFIPVAKINRIVLTSPWPDPSFMGSYLPRSHEVSKDGFQADWSVSFLSRNYPQLWNSESTDFNLLSNAVQASAFGVNLFLSVDHYHKAERSVKYAILFIALTFAAFFLFEVTQKLTIHPFQYLLIGFAMSLFYLLLLSLSEHVDFTASYLMASCATIGLIIGYSAHLLAEKGRAVFFGGLLVILYASLYTLLRLEDFALLFGSLLLLIVLGLLMFTTRKIDWYEIRLNRSAKREK